jgi:hypothetical protein
MWRLRRRRLRIEGPIPPAERSWLIWFTARLGFLIGIGVGAALLVWWFNE